VKQRRDTHLADRVFAQALKVPSFFLVLLLGLIAWFLYKTAAPAHGKFGLGFLTTRTWDPVQDIYGALPFIFGTVASSLLAICIAAAVSIGIALFLNELAPRRVSRVIGFLVEMLAAIPSVVYGLWGIFILAPWLRVVVEPFLAKHLGFLPLFQGPPYGVGMLAAGIILAIMITPTISSISREVFKAIPRDQREAALALGATRWEMMRISVLNSAKTGVWGAIILGLGRALGETMAVTMVIGNVPQIKASLLAPAYTIPAVIANEFTEATSDLYVAALIYAGVVLLIVTVIVNVVARVMVGRVARGLAPIRE
jgi:phosphate transport system permease protein